jgi:hypothetical protein
MLWFAWGRGQVFVANPKKPPDVAAILFNNKEKLIVYLENFHNEKGRLSDFVLLPFLSQFVMLDDGFDARTHARAVLICRRRAIQRRESSANKNSEHSR